ncbi:MAG: GDP-mannose 4,6-dehydratase [bacterium]|nr:GDP-mannose 4,6-dehydratase [bacterium]
MKRVLITGGAGFVGLHLAKRLAAQDGYEVYIVDNFFRSQDDAELATLKALPNVAVREADLTRKETWDDMSGFDQVYHLVGINGTRLFYEIPHEVLRIGVSTILHGLEWFRTKNKTPNAKIIYTSSNEAYGDALKAFGQLPLPTPESVPLVVADPYNPRSSYSAQKLIGELFFIHYAKAYNFRMSIVRPHNFYGPRAGYEHVIPEVVGRVSAKVEPFPIFGADDTRSFCYIDDAVEAIQAVMESSATDSGTYHIGTTEETVISDLVQNIFVLMGWKPQTLDIKNSPEGSVKRRLADVSKIKKDTGWEAKTPLEDGLKKTIEWYLKNPKPAGK